MLGSLATELRLPGVVNRSDAKDHFPAKLHRFSSCDAVSLFVVAVDSPVSKVTGGWMDKTKDQINSFSPSLIARWEPKLFFFFLFKLQALTKLLIYLWPLENGIPAHLAL